MLNRMLGTGVLLVAAIASCAHADIMHWFWEVEVNGLAVDATQPIVVEVGDQVDIELWAEWEPHRWGFATGLFSIAASDEFFHAASKVDISEDHGFGRNASLRELCTEGGSFLDTDNSGFPDAIDTICAAQLPFFINDTFDDSNPLRVYAMEWTLSADLSEPVALIRAPTADNEMLMDQVFEDQWGTMVDYSPVHNKLSFVPSPSTGILVMTILAAQCRRRSRNAIRVYLVDVAHPPPASKCTVSDHRGLR